jgi:septal ring-binding cell division protein DamX
MSDYTLAVNWSGKDALSDSDANKVISGADFNTEFTTVRTAVNSKQDINGDSGEDFAMNNGTVAGTLTITGNPTAPTQSAGNSSTRLATTAFVQGEKASPTFTGTPAAPTAATATDTTQIATTAFVQANTPAASQTVLGMAKIWTSGGDLYIATS